MKKLGMLLVVLLLVLMLSLASAAGYTEVDTDFSACGVQLTLPGDYSDLQGTVRIKSAGIISYEPRMYCLDCMYSAMPEEEMQAFMNAVRDGTVTDEQYLDYVRSYVYIGCLIGSDASMEETARALKAEVWDWEKSFEAGAAGNLKFYYFAFPEDDYHVGYDAFTAKLDPSFVDEVNVLDRDIREAVRSGSFFEPHTEISAAKGRTLTFESFDLDGNPVKSEELFAENEITMVNVWGTWCGNCLKEMPDLAEMHRAMREKGCGIVGIEHERAWSSEVVEKARGIWVEYGLEYPNVVRPETNEVLDMIQGYPTTFFVDRSGKILYEPIEGAVVDQYSKVLESLLQGMPAQETDAVTGEVTYRIVVTDDDGAVPDVTIQFCDDRSCSFGDTDEDGVAAFTKPAGIYEVHVLEVPDGYQEDETVYHTEEGSSELRLHIVKES